MYIFKHDFYDVYIFANIFLAVQKFSFFKTKSVYTHTLYSSGKNHSKPKKRMMLFFPA